MATLQDSYNTGDNASAAFYGIYWNAMTFQASGTYTVAEVKLLLWRTGSPGTLTASIRATSAGVPTGADLCSGTANGDAITTSSAGEWVTFDLGAGTELSSGTTYAIVLHGGSDVSNRGNQRYDNTGGYADGSYYTSVTSGVTWAISSGNDCLFETYSDTVSYEVTGTVAGVGTVSGAVFVEGIKEVTGTVAGVGVITGDAIIQTAFVTETFKNIKRLVLAGSDSIWYEDK